MDHRTDIVPDFTLVGAHGEDVREFTLSEFAGGRAVVLVFYIYDYSPVCTAQTCEVNDMEFLTFDESVAVLGISTDGPYSHREFIADNNLSYPLLTDDDMHVYEQFGMITHTDDGRRKPKRGIVLLDADRTVRYRWEAESNWDEWQTRPLEEVHDSIRELDT